MKRVIQPSDLLSPEEYSRRRRELRKTLIERKKKRRVEVGPIATFYFECFETMLAQIQEMLHIERGGEAQLADELAAYNPLVPKGGELVATLMFEIEDPDRRARELSKLGGIEHHIFMRIGPEEIQAEAEGERTNEQGKTSSVHFLHFRLNENQVKSFQDKDTEVILGFHHGGYAHMAQIPSHVRDELSKDL
jgi:Protein of unknown function (DUF3501)